MTRFSQLSGIGLDPPYPPKNAAEWVQCEIWIQRDGKPVPYGHRMGTSVGSGAYDAPYASEWVRCILQEVPLEIF